MTSREKVIGFLQETAEYFRECRSNVSFASKAENHFFELQNAANEVAELLKEQENGKWIDHTFAHGDDIECPFCHKKWNVIDNCTETFEYCPGCGAKLS